MTILSNRYKQERGVVILYAVLLVSIVLTISLSLLNITYKQIILTAVGRDSQIAHFNAWSVIDCIARTNRQYQDDGADQVANPFGQLDLTGVSLTPNPSPSNFACNTGGEALTAVNESPPDPLIVGDSVRVESVWNVWKLTNPSGSFCATANVVKVLSGNYADFPGEEIGDNDNSSLMITALGYNSSHPCVGSQSSRLVERQIRAKIVN